MRYLYENNKGLHYSEARADVATLLPNGFLGQDLNWLAMGAKSLTLWFYGQSNNDANEKMYVKLVDSDTPVHSTKVVYSGDMNDIREKKWHEWNIDLAKFTNVNLAKVKTIIIGFGDGATTGTGTVFFEDVQVYTTRCALVNRDADFAKLDYAPSVASGSGDCVIDYQEIQIMARDWLNRDTLIATKKPSDTNLVVYYPMNEGEYYPVSAGDSNKIYSHPNPAIPDYCDTKWTGTFWNNGAATPGYFGTRWETPGYDGSTAPDVNHCVYLNGSQGSRIQCGDTNENIPGHGYGHLGLGIGGGKTGLTSCAGDVNAITLSVWVKWLGPRTWDGYLMSKSQGILGKRGGWDDTHMVWMLECDTGGGGSSFGLRHYATGDTTTPDVYTANNILNQYIGQWVHLAATFPHPAADTVADANSHAWLYLNGGQVGNGPWRFSNGDDPNIFLSIGETQDQNAWPECPESFYGYIDEVRIYNHALEPNEIGYLADVTPLDGQQWVPIPSSANVYDGNEISPYIGNQPQGQRSVNFKDFAAVVKRWLDEEMFPR
jgi:hypothetical protein